MAKYRIGTVKHRYYMDDVEGNRFLNELYAALKLEKQQQSTRWKLAAAVAERRYLLNASPPNGA